MCARVHTVLCGRALPLFAKHAWGEHGGACSDVPCRDKSGLLSRDRAGWLDRSLSPCQYAQCAKGGGKFSLWVTYLNMQFICTLSEMIEAAGEII